jgi:hypothetical protein
MRADYDKNDPYTNPDLLFDFMGFFETLVRRDLEKLLRPKNFNNPNATREEQINALIEYACQLGVNKKLIEEAALEEYMA